MHDEPSTYSSGIEIPSGRVGMDNVASEWVDWAIHFDFNYSVCRSAGSGPYICAQKRFCVVDGRFQRIDI